MDKYESTQVIGGGLLFLVAIRQVFTPEHWVSFYVPNSLEPFGFEILILVSLLGIGIGSLMVLGSRTKKMILLAMGWSVGMIILLIFSSGIEIGRIVVTEGLLYLTLAGFYSMIYLIHSENTEEIVIYPVE